MAHIALMEDCLAFGARWYSARKPQSLFANWCKCPCLSGLLPHALFLLQPRRTGSSLRMAR
jgi:hypothetical protein